MKGESIGREKERGGASEEEAMGSSWTANDSSLQHRTTVSIIAIVLLSMIAPPSSSSSDIRLRNDYVGSSDDAGDSNGHLFAHGFTPIVQHRPLAAPAARASPSSSFSPSFSSAPLPSSTGQRRRAAAPPSRTAVFDKAAPGNDAPCGCNTTSDSDTSLSASAATEPPIVPMTDAPEIDQWKTFLTTPPDEANHPPPSLDGAHLRFMSPYDRLEVEKYWDRLMPSVAYLGSRSASRIKKSLVVAYCAHRSQLRKSGEPFVVHPVEVGLLLAGLRSDAETVIAGLLHDTVEDTDMTFQELELMFGPEVRALVEGETKVSKLPTLEFEDYADEQAENLRQMFMAMTDDYRIIVLKLADRLHNMRTLQYMKPDKQEKISRETLDIFAPLAHRMGLWQFKSELEDTAFMYLYPDEYRRLDRRLRRNQSKFRDTLERSQQILRDTLAADRTLGQQANVQVYGRRKEVYSLWSKMRAKGEDNVSKITDVVALRVIIHPNELTTPSSTIDGVGGGQTEGAAAAEKAGGKDQVGVVLCYHVLGLVQNLPGFQPVPTKVKDYISCPKPNGYQSLHTALMLNDQQIEVQIRTNAMHRVAEYGMAAHWAFYDEKKRRNRKSSTSSSSSSSSSIIDDRSRDADEEREGEDDHDLYNTPWLSSIKEWQDEGQDDNFCSREFVDCVRREMLGKRAYVFLRNGKILNLAKGATVVDAAFQIRTDVGLKMEGVEINGKPVPFSYELKNGDVISVLTGKGRPHTEWMKYAMIRSTRSKLRSCFRERQREKFIDAGRTSLLHYLYVHADLIRNFCPEIGSADDIPQNHSDIEPCLLRLLRLTLSSGSSDNNAEPEEDSIRDDIKDLLEEVGKRSLDGKDDQVFLRGKVADIFRVPREDLEKADLGCRNINSDQPYDYNNYKECGNFMEQQQLGTQNGDLIGENITSSSSPSSLSEGKDKTRIEIADPEYTCPHCLPILGDEIIGTRVARNNNNNNFYDDIQGDYFATTTVHRCGCPVVPPHRTRINTRKTNNNVDGVRSTSSRLNLRQNVGLSGVGFGSTGTRNSADEGTMNKGRASNSSRSLPPGARMSVSKATTGSTSTLEAVPLRWDDSYISSPLFLAEVTIVASDRKLLLADCSEVVSSMSEIVKTGSLSNAEHAILEFLVKVESLGHLQKVMNSLMGIPNVMSVERKFGSSL